MSPPSDTPTSQPPEPPQAADPIAHVDDLLTQYLETLDSYQSLRTQLSKSFSDGFISLANANRTSLLGAGRRYGEEGFDQRMKAGRRVCVGLETGIGRVECQVASFEAGLSGGNGEDESEEKRNQSPDAEDGTGKRASQLPTPPREDAPRPSGPQKTAKDSSGFRDPIRWYGILVPPSLRSAQSSFIDSVENHVPGLIEIQSTLRRLEDDIRTARTAAGLDVRETEDVGDEDQGNEHEEIPEIVQKASSRKARKSVDKNGRKSISGSLSSRSRAADPPVSRVLKLEK